MLCHKQIRNSELRNFDFRNYVFNNFDHGFRNCDLLPSNYDIGFIKLIVV